MSTINDYIGRTVDLLAFKDASPDREKLLRMALVGEGDRGEVTAGIQKLAQRWLIEILTEEGSLRYDSNRGTIFMIEARLGRIRNTADAEQVFFFAADQARFALQAEETDDTPLDEAYSRVELESITVLDGFMLMRVRLYSVLGNDREILLPIDVRTG